MKKHLFLILLLLSSCTLPFGKEDETLVLPAPVIQWAETASASSAYGGVMGQNRDDQSPYAATGEPDVDDCIDSPKAWVSDGADRGLQWLELQYAKKVYPAQIRIRQTLSPGAIVKVELFDKEDSIVVWEGEDTPEDCPAYMVINLEEKKDNITMKMADFKTNTVKITLNTDVPGWNEIDAVELTGYDQRWYVLNDTVILE